MEMKELDEIKNNLRHQMSNCMTRNGVIKDGQAGIYAQLVLARCEVEKLIQADFVGKKYNKEQD